MSCPTFKVTIGVPIFGLAFTSSNQLILGGGGGNTRSGVKNKLSSFKVDVRRKDLEEDATFEFEKGEDAPMCLDVHPRQDYVVTSVNSTVEDMMARKNTNCRHFKIAHDKFELEKALSTLQSEKEEDYQKVVRFSEDGSLVATGNTDGYVNVFRYPEFEAICEPIQVSTDDEVLDVDINLEKEKLTCVLRDGLRLINLRGKNVGQIVQTISATTVVKNEKTQFRAFRYGRGYTKDFGFAVVNGITKPGAFIVKYDAYSFDQVKMSKVSSKPITAFTIGQDGAVLAFASADLSITLLDAQTLKVLTKVKDAHTFSITSIAISPDRRLLASASADTTCRIVSLPLQFNNALSINPLYTLLLALVVAGLLLLLMSVLDLDPYFKAREDAYKNPVSAETTTTADNVATLSPSATIEAIITTIIAETPTFVENVFASKDEL
ncbi:hypothetical protein INT47_007629 [Mucor saturninus]|uniref:Uncharacterized protein n=1 Tax=Mucor saturninus TaxID=64648 RepID=A0A8H7V638_9FUNG|nr:hypothetical protein INT47_007629 [Mucor saturninus]